MYHCHIRFYLMGHHHAVFEEIKKMPALEHFTHEFMESDSPETELAAKADVIFADLQDMDEKEAMRILCAGMRKEAQLILFANKDQTGAIADGLQKVSDIWNLPLTGEEIRFRFLRWQQTCKMSKDYWQTSHYLEATINNVPNLIWYKDKNGIHEKVNDSFCLTVGKTKEQVEGRGHAYIWDVEQDDPACIESENQVMQTRQTFVSEEKVKAGDGMKLLTTYKSPLYDIDGSVMGTVGVAIDVTKEREYEQEIVQKNISLETIFTNLDCGVMRHTLDGRKLLSINRAALKILGYESRDELMDGGFDLVASSVLEEDKEKLTEAIRELKKAGDSVSVEYRVQHRDGEILHIMGNIKLLQENGELVYQRFLLDCTEQKLQEKRNERRQMELIQALGIDYSFICFFDLETGLGFPIRSDDDKEELFHFDFNGQISLKESMEFYINNFVYEEDREALLRISCTDELKKELSEKRVSYMNYRAVKTSGIKYFQVKIVRTGTWNGDFGVVIGFRSVDDEIRSEMEKKSLLEDALMQANRANKAKSIFLSNMSHDIRTPMNAIVGFTSLAISHIDRKDQVEEYLGKIMSSGNHLLSLINDVLDMSRIESGKIHLDEKPCSLPDILHGLKNILQADIHAKQLELYMDAVDVVDEEIYCDKLRLNQLLLNLLGNSVKYTGAGGTVSMRITEKPDAPEGYGNYEFLIRDNGIGMSQEFVEHIFEPFEREKSTTISGIPGTGLGMAITKNIVDMMNGTIEVKSALGKGTEFKVSLMFRLSSGAQELKDIPELKDCRALVVDDDFNTCDSVSYMLGQLGMRAEWTLSGKEAVLRTRQAAMREDNYGVYIIDWLLPDMNGVEVARRIRKETGGRGPVIVLTAYDWSDIEEEAREAGVAAFCSKPLFLSELRSCLYSIMNNEKEEREEETGAKASKLREGRILLAEDNELNQEIAVAILGDAGFNTEVAGNGKTAVDMLGSSEPGYYQLVLMDVQMPVMNGYEAARQIRSLENEKLASIPILAMTANAFEEDKQEALKNGMNGHIAKPIDIENLLNTLDAVLN